MAEAPVRTELSDTYPNPSNAVMRTGMGKLWDWLTGLLPVSGTIADARVKWGVMAADISNITAEAGGTANAITASFTPAITAIADKMMLSVRATAENTEAVTFTPNSGTLAAWPIKKGAGADLVYGDIAGAGHVLDLRADTVNEWWLLLNPAKGVTISSWVPELVKPDPNSPCLIKTAYNTIAIKAGTTLLLDSGPVAFTVQTAVAMPTLTAGEDYSVWVHPDGTASCVVDSFVAPASAPVTGAKRIGGFHYGLVTGGTTVAGGSFATSGVTTGGGSMAWTQTLVDDIAGINKYSIWDLQWRCEGDQYGMAYDSIKNMWAGIYLMSDSPHLYGLSRYNTNIASGTVLPYIPAKWGGNGTLKYSRLSSFEANELVSARGLRLPTYEEFMSFAFGVTEAQSLGGAASTVPATTRQAGYTSRIGIEQATGHQWIIGSPVHSVGGSAWADVGRGQIYAGAGLALFGGDRDVAAYSGSRCANFSGALSTSGWSIGVRAAGDHLNLARGAR